MSSKKHAALGASSAHRWMICPGSIRLSSGVERKESEHAREGTAAHALASNALDAELEPIKYVGGEFEGVEVTPEMAEHVGVYTDYVRRIHNEFGGELLVEQRVSLDALKPPAEMFGTVDAAILTDDALHVIDLKYGQGVFVPVVDNPQLQYYALALLAERKPFRVPKQITVTVVQPRRLDGDGNAIRSWTFTDVDLKDFKRRLFAAAKRATAPGAPVGPVGDHCRWCPAQPFCPAQQKNALTVAKREFTADPAQLPNIPPPELLPEPVLIQVLERAPYVEQWITAVRRYAYEQLETGKNVPGFKLVQKRGVRRWDETKAPEAVLAAEIGEQAYKPHELISPAQAEKAGVPKEVVAELSESVSSGLTLAPESDPRPPVNLLSAGEEFSAS